MAEEANGPEGFIAGLRRCGANPQRRAGLIVHEVEPVDGQFAGELVLIGVEGAGGCPVAYGAAALGSSARGHRLRHHESPAVGARRVAAPLTTDQGVGRRTRTGPGVARARPCCGR